MKAYHLFYYLMILVTIISCGERNKTKEQVAKSNTNDSPEIMTIESTDGVIINYTKYGHQKEAIVFVHGWSCDQTYWREQIDYFKSDYQIVTVDLAGHGKSTQGTRDDWTIPKLSEDLIKVIGKLDYNQVTIVGHSLGSMVVIDAATRLNKDNTKVIAVDYLKRPLKPISEEIIEGYLSGFRSDFKTSMKNFVTNLFRPDADSTLRLSITNDMAAAPQAVAIPLTKDLTTRDFSGLFTILEEKNIPRYIINSDLSPIVNSHYEELGFEMEVAPETGHFLMMEKPKEFNQALKKCL